MDWLDVVIIAVNVVVVFGFLLVSVMMTIWVERRIVAFMQQRYGPNRVGPFGMLQSLADGVKLFFKEGITPTQADRPVYLVAPVLSMLPAFLAFAVIPFGVGVTLFGHFVPFQIANLNIGILWIFAMSSNENPKTSCSTNAPRSAGVSRSRTTSIAIRTLSSRVIRSAGSARYWKSTSGAAVGSAEASRSVPRLFG